MQVSIEKKALGGLLAVLGAFALLAALAPAAKATEVTPTDQSIKVINNDPTHFIPNNAYDNDGIRCLDSQMEFTIESTDRNHNINRPGVGTHSGQTIPKDGNGHGSVITSMDPNRQDGTKSPQWQNCTQFDYSSASIGFNAIVRPNTTHGNWTIAAHASPIRDAMLSIGVPAAGAVIEVQVPLLPNCFITVSDDGRDPGAASTVMAEWHNPPAGRANNGFADVDGQIDFTFQGSTCPDMKSPAQFEGVYEPDRPVYVLP